MAIQKVAVIGCGQMGLGMAESVAAAGFPVVAVKLTPGELAGPKRTLTKGLDRRVERGKLTEQERDGIVARIQFASELTAIADADLVIESCVEELATKAAILAKVEAVLREDALLATNTSSLKLRELARGLRRPQRFLGLHFFNPVPAMKLVELSPTPDTSADVVAQCDAFCVAIGKTPVRIEDSPGYVVNRLLVPYMLHAIETLDHGIAGAEAIDTAMKLGCGHPMGPLALADLIGLDVVFAMARTMHGELRDNRYRSPSLLRRLVLAGHLGRKTGRGIYDYSNAAAPTVNAVVGAQRATATGT